MSFLIATIMSLLICLWSNMYLALIQLVGGRTGADTLRVNWKADPCHPGAPKMCIIRLSFRFWLCILNHKIGPEGGYVFSFISFIIQEIISLFLSEKPKYGQLHFNSRVTKLSCEHHP